MKMKKEELSEEKKALRGSEFAPLPLSLHSSSRSQPRLAHPGGPLTTNKAAALAKFLERKLQDLNGLASINPDLLQLAVKNAKETVLASCTSSSGRSIKHVDSFGDEEVTFEEENDGSSELKKRRKKKKKKRKKTKNKRWRTKGVPKPKKKLKL